MVIFRLLTCDDLFLPVFTARKRILGQGNVFTPVCPRGRGVYPSMQWAGGVTRGGCDQGVYSPSPYG